MSIRTWAKPLGITLGVSAAAGAAQLGIAYGLTILLWARDFQEPGNGAWAANLTWVCWLAAASVVLGVVAGRRLTLDAGLPRSVVTQVARVTSAAVGALVTVPLAAIPARYAEAAGDAAPVSTVARVALVGVLLGAVVSVGVLLGRPLEWNTLTTTAVLWTMGLGSVLVWLGRTDTPEAVQLAVWRYAEAPGWFAVITPMLAGTLLIGAALAWLAKRQGCSRVEVAVCGAPGPLVVAVAYLVAGPGARPETGEQFLPYLAAPYAVLTGLLGSLLVSAIEWPARDDESGGEADGSDPSTEQIEAAEHAAEPAAFAPIKSEPATVAEVIPAAETSAEEPEATEEPVPELDESEEWLRQIKGDDTLRTRRPAAGPHRPRRGKWSLFGDEEAVETGDGAKTTSGD